MDGWTDGRMDGWTDGRMDGRTDGQTNIPCILQDIIPLGPLPKKPRASNPAGFHAMSSRESPLGQVPQARTPRPTPKEKFGWTALFQINK